MSLMCILGAYFLLQLIYVYNDVSVGIVLRRCTQGQGIGKRNMQNMELECKTMREIKNETKSTDVHEWKTAENEMLMLFDVSMCNCFCCPLTPSLQCCECNIEKNVCRRPSKGTCTYVGISAIHIYVLICFPTSPLLCSLTPQRIFSFILNNAR